MLRDILDLFLPSIPDIIYSKTCLQALDYLLKFVHFLISKYCQKSLVKVSNVRPLTPCIDTIQYVYLHKIKNTTINLNNDFFGSELFL